MLLELFLVTQEKRVDQLSIMIYESIHHQLIGNIKNFNSKLKHYPERFYNQISHSIFKTKILIKAPKTKTLFTFLVSQGDNGHQKKWTRPVKEFCS